MVIVRLMSFLGHKGIISPAQCDFQEFHSTIDILVHLESTICEALLSYLSLRKHMILLLGLKFLRVS